MFTTEETDGNRKLSFQTHDATSNCWKNCHKKLQSQNGAPNRMMRFFLEMDISSAASWIEEVPIKQWIPQNNSQLIVISLEH
jgi:hypothetical protein